MNDDIISLNLVYTYPVKWSKYKVLRDLIQNFYDAVGPHEWKERFIYKMENSHLSMEVANVSFSYDWLIHIGASTKRDSDRQYAGYFGEGFKIASLCALRDHGWGITMASKDWKLEVVNTDINIDNSTLKSLAYKVKKYSKRRNHSILTISSFREVEIFESARLSFFYKENPLFGKKIWSSTFGAIYHRSSFPKPYNYPSTYWYGGEGIVFSGFQALGSLPTPLVFCLHGEPPKNRERDNFYRMDVISAVNKIVNRIPPEAALELLTALKKKWYQYPKKKYDFDSWYSIIKDTVRAVAESEKCVKKLRKAFPFLIVAKKVSSSNIVQKNRRSQALAWMKKQDVKYKLVQDGFLRLGYPELERVCEENDGFNVTRLPTENEKKRIRLLETVTKALFQSYMASEELPPAQVIKNESGAWQGMTSCIKLARTVATPSGNNIKFKLPYIALKSNLFCKHNFPRAMSTYLHEFAHAFGGDHSANFSYVVSEFLEVILVNHKIFDEFSTLWDALETDSPDS